LQNINKQNEAAVNKVNELVEEASALVKSITAHSTKITDAQTKEKLLTVKRNELMEKYTKRAAEVWDSASENCPTCNRALPAEDIERLKSDFNLAKSTDLLKISAKGKAEASADMITEQQNIAHNAQTIVDSLTAKHKVLCALIDEERAKVVKTAFEETAAYKTLSDEVEVCKTKEYEAKTETGDNDEKFLAQLTAITEKISGCEVKLEQIKTRKTQLERMAELQEEEKRYSKEIESLEAGIFMCDTFTRRKVKLLDSSINSRFENVRFRLFIDQVNGGLREDCEVLIPSPDGNLVPYSTANGGAKIIAGIEIIKVLSEHWGLNVPLFVDNAESITSEFETKGQMIRLTANKRDTVLRVDLYDDGAEPEISLTAS
jgi:DNA repair exonuclease SbcCD ATPase subunit